jgi:glutamyl-tRNA synthetase
MTPSPRDKVPVRVRFAPSPTGLLHLGGARTALYNVLLARQTGGQFILRFEDTDQKRYSPEAEQDLKDSLRWLGLNWDEGIDVGGPHAPYRQTERKAIYLEYAEKLVDSGHAFYCFCSGEELTAAREAQQKAGQQTRYPGTCRDLDAEAAKARVIAGDDHVIRFKMPLEGSTTVVDRVRGEITFENKNLDDYIIVRTDGLALYHLAAMVDDHLMDITHVFRGEEWISTFPLHVRIYEAFGWRQPEWVHLSLFLKPSGKGKMSKRETEEMRLAGDSIFIKDMHALGYLPEAVNNWTALMGWSFDGSTEFFAMHDLIEKFSIDKLSAKNAAIDFKKFDHFNKLHIQALSDEELAERLLPYFTDTGIDADMDTLLQLAPLLKTRLTSMDEAVEWSAFLFSDDVAPDPTDLVPKGLTAAQTLTATQRALDLLTAAKNFDQAEVEDPFRTLAEELEIKLGQLLTPIRVAISGQPVSPPLFESMQIIGRETSLNRIAHAITLLEQLAANE